MRIPDIRTKDMDAAARLYDCIDAICDACESDTKCNNCCINEIRSSLRVEDAN